MVAGHRFRLSFSNMVFKKEELINLTPFRVDEDLGEYVFHLSVVNVLEEDAAFKLVKKFNDDIASIYLFASYYINLNRWTDPIIDNYDKWDAEQIKQYNIKLLISANNQVELLFNLLNWSKVQTDRIPYIPVLFDLISELKYIISTIQEMSDAKGVVFKVNMPQSALVTGDSNMLTIVILNLLINAVKFTNKGGNVTFEIEPLDSGKYIISVRDTGIGISEELMNELFRIDIQNSRLGTSGEQGSGLGLIVSKELLEKHNTSLHIESKEDIGSRFYFILKS